MASPPPAKKPRTEVVRNPPGKLDTGAGILSSFSGPAVNRMIPRRFAREFGRRYSSSNNSGAFTILRQAKQILQLVEPTTSGASVASQLSGFGFGGVSIIDLWPTTHLTHTVMILAMRYQKTWRISFLGYFVAVTRLLCSLRMSSLPLLFGIFLAASLRVLLRFEQRAYLPIERHYLMTINIEKRFQFN